MFPSALSSPVCMPVNTQRYFFSMKKKNGKISMSGFMKTVSNLRQNFRACLLAMEAFAALEKPGGVWGGGGGGSVKRVRADSPGAWLPCS